MAVERKPRIVHVIHREQFMLASISNQAFSRRTPPTVEVVEVSILLPIELFDALETLASEHEMTLGQMTRLMLALGMSPSALCELSRRADAIRRRGSAETLTDL